MGSNIAHQDRRGTHGVWGPRLPLGQRGCVEGAAPHSLPAKSFSLFPSQLLAEGFDGVVAVAVIGIQEPDSTTNSIATATRTTTSRTSSSNLSSIQTSE